MKRFVLVTAVVTATGASSTKASGIRKLKRGVLLTEFIQEHLQSIGVHQFETIDRDGSTVVMTTTGDSICSWYFTEYQETELFTAVAHLTRDELLRDLKELLPLREAT